MLRRIIILGFLVGNGHVLAGSSPVGTMHFSCEALTAPVTSVEVAPAHEYTLPGTFSMPDPVVVSGSEVFVSPWAVQLMAARDDGVLKQLAAKLPDAVIVGAKAPGFKALQLRNYVDEAAGRAALQRLKVQYPGAFLLKPGVDG